MKYESKISSYTIICLIATSKQSNDVATNVLHSIDNKFNMLLKFIMRNLLEKICDVWIERLIRISEKLDSRCIYKYYNIGGVIMSDDIMKIYYHSRLPSMSLLYYNHIFYAFI